MEKNRITWLDNAKAFAIILVVLGHCARSFTKSNYDIFGAVQYFIYCFHMEFFFILSGMSYRFSQRSTDFRSKARHTILHCFDFAWAVLIFNVLSDILLILSKGGYGDISLLRLMFQWANRYWYISVLCLIYLIVPWFRKIDLRLLTVLLALELLCGLVHMGAGKFLLYLFFFTLGIYLPELEIDKYCVLFGAVFLAGSSVWYFLSDGSALMDVYTKTIFGLTGSLFFAIIIRREEKRREEKRREEKRREEKRREEKRREEKRRILCVLKLAETH